MAEHDVVGAGAAVDRLVEVVAHRILVREAREVGHVALLHVVEAERGGPFARRRIGERGRLRRTVGAGADRHFDPGEQVGVAARRVVAAGGRGVAVQLLPHLIEAMHRALGIGVIGHRRGVGELEGTGRQRIHVGDARVRRTTGERRVGRLITAGDQELIVVGSKARFSGLRIGDGRREDVGVLGAADDRRGKLVVGEFLLRRAQQERISRSSVRCGGLMRLFEVRAGDRILVLVELDDALGEQVVDALAGPVRHVSGEHVIEAAVFADDDDDVLDRRAGFVAAAGEREAGESRQTREARKSGESKRIGQDRGGDELTQRHDAEGKAATLQPT